MTAIEVLAPAKINLTLHVTGQREDGYHLLDSLVTFAELGDRLTVRKAQETSLRVTGPFAKDVPAGPDNLVLRAAALLGVTAAITLDKRLPVASGIGGGSADAAAALEGLTDLYNIPMPTVPEMLTLGADVPVCALGGMVRMRGIGDAVEVVRNYRPNLSMVLVNPRVPISTPAVFRGLEDKNNAPMEEPMPRVSSDDFTEWLRRQRNDLEAPAIAIAPVINGVLTALQAMDGVQVARMSGSGATCFALFYDERLAADAVGFLRDRHPDWWVEVGID